MIFVLNSGFLRFCAWISNMLSFVFEEVLRPGFFGFGRQTTTCWNSYWLLTIFTVVKLSMGMGRVSICNNYTVCEFFLWKLFKCSRFQTQTSAVCEISDSVFFFCVTWLNNFCCCKPQNQDILQCAVFLTITVEAVGRNLTSSLFYFPVFLNSFCIIWTFNIYVMSQSRPFFLRKIFFEKCFLRNQLAKLYCAVFAKLDFCNSWKGTGKTCLCRAYFFKKLFLRNRLAKLQCAVFPTP